MFSSIVGSHVELDPWRKEHSAYPEVISTCVINLSADFLYAHPHDSSIAVVRGVCFFEVSSIFDAFADKREP